MYSSANIDHALLLYVRSKNLYINLARTMSISKMFDVLQYFCKVILHVL